MASLLFCACGSDRVDLRTWSGANAHILCLTCRHQAWLERFTLSEFDASKLLTGALVDHARKHRKRPAQEVEELEQRRRSG